MSIDQNMAFRQAGAGKLYAYRHDPLDISLGFAKRCICLIHDLLPDRAIARGGFFRALLLLEERGLRVASLGCNRTAALVALCLLFLFANSRSALK